MLICVACMLLSYLLGCLVELLVFWFVCCVALIYLVDLLYLTLFMSVFVVCGLNVYFLNTMLIGFF